ncbi:hypothetical protein Tco_0841329, partial [Tanacetum coccineum]
GCYSRTKESEPSKKSSFIKESSKDDTTQTKDKAPKYDWFNQPPPPPTPDPEWNTRQVVDDQPEQPWFNNMLSATKDPLTFDELMVTPIDFSKFAMNRDCCPYDLSKPLPFKGRPGRLTVPSEYFFNNDLEYLKASDLEKKYTTSIMKKKAARYELVGIEDMIPILWSVTKPWFNNMLSAAKEPLTFNELMATPINLSKFEMNHLKIDKLTESHLVGPVYNLLKGTCQRDCCPYDLGQPLPLKGRPGRLTVPSEYFFNNNLEYPKASDLEKKYTTSITKTKAARYELVGIEDMIPIL